MSENVLSIVDARHEVIGSTIEELRMLDEQLAAINLRRADVMARLEHQHASARESLGKILSPNPLRRNSDRRLAATASALTFEAAEGVSRAAWPPAEVCDTEGGAA